MKKGFQPKIVEPNTPPPIPRPDQTRQPEQGGLPAILQQMSTRLTTLENNLQNIFGFIECKTNVMLKIMIEKDLVTTEIFDVKFKEENKRILAQFEAVNDNVLKRVVSKDPVKTGDWVLINFKGTVDGAPFDGGASERFEFKIGDEHIMDDLQNGIIGKKAEEKFDVDVVFPENYVNKEVAGKKAIFSVEILSVKTQIEETA